MNQNHQWPGILCLACFLILAACTVPVSAGNSLTVSGVILPPAAPAAAFSGIPVSGNVPLTVQFYDQSTNNPASWKWEYRKGSGSWTQFSMEKNPLLTFTATGKYSIRLTVANAGGRDTAVKQNYITVNPVPAPKAAFSGIPTSGPAPLKVQFTDQSTNEPTSWVWEYKKESGSWTQFSTEKNPLFIFVTAGRYSIRLTVANAGGSDTITKPNLITVLEPVHPPVAIFTQDRYIGNVPLTIHFTDRSLNDPAIWEWQFGDGGTSPERNPVHTYTHPGIYLTRERVSNAAGSDTAYGAVVVLGGWWVG